MSTDLVAAAILAVAPCVSLRHHHHHYQSISATVVILLQTRTEILLVFPERLILPRFQPRLLIASPMPTKVLATSIQDTANGGLKRSLNAYKLDRDLPTLLNLGSTIATLWLAPCIYNLFFLAISIQTLLLMRKPCNPSTFYMRLNGLLHTTYLRNLI